MNNNIIISISRSDYNKIKIISHSSYYSENRNYSRSYRSTWMQYCAISASGLKTERNISIWKQRQKAMALQLIPS